MNIDPSDFKRVMELVDMKSSKKIIDLEKYYYWHFKADETLDIMNESKEDKEKYANCYHLAMLYTLERNRYYKMPKRDVFVFKIVLKHHNSVSKDKLYCDSKGRKTTKETNKFLK